MTDIFTWIVLTSTVVILAATMARLRQVEKRLAALTLVDKQIEFLLKNSGVTFDPFAGISKEAAGALRGSATKIEAIKRYRETTNVGLKDAKLAIEAAIKTSGIAL